MMGTREMTTKIRLAHWAEVIQERVTSGEKINDFCLRKGISRNSYIYWLRKLRKTACEHLTALPCKSSGLTVQRFAEVKLTGPDMAPSPIEANQICIETISYRITAGNAYPAEALVLVLREATKP